ncbi:hypothetical protein CKO12_05215 [Chromatium okenii]|uniref:hypothetical protein n=1 Tax=Chromatium okenii TaxID=61644 RepID=UPI0019074E16|nr:hypothetical protein [Chromatium okenii]MBK1641282.1 hypothetical protein [Chromatium okenii]
MESRNTLTLTPVNGELRIRDIDLAERLGFADPRMIRKLIKSNSEKLNEFSILYAVEKKHGGVGRPATEYYLDRKQSIFICMKSETANAFEVQFEIVEVYDAHLTNRAAQPAVADPVLAALVHGLVEIDRLKQQQVLITRKTEQLESRVEHVELQHRNGVPKGYLSRSQAHVLYGIGLSAEVFHLALHRLEVPTTPYIHHAEDGNEVATYGYLESDIAAAVQTFLDDAIQATRYMCESPLLEGKRFRYNKSTVTRPNPPQQ